MKKIDKTDTLSDILKGKHFTVDEYQREYRWGRKHIEQMLSDFQGTFEEYYKPDAHVGTSEVANYGCYYLGCLICSCGNGSAVKKIIDGQQRLTSLTLLFIYLIRLQKEQKALRSARPGVPEPKTVRLDDLVYADHFGEPGFNLDIPSRRACMQALLDGTEDSFKPEDESSRNLLERYADLEECFPDELKGEALPYFIYWLMDKVLLLELDTPSDDEAHTIFLSVNDRGLRLNSAEMMKAYVIQHVTEAGRGEVNHCWQENINRIKKASLRDLSGAENTEDVEFISAWLRAKYAKTLRESRVGASDQDYERLGDRFHVWVREHAKDQIGLQDSDDYKKLILTEMTRMTHLYLRLLKYSSEFTQGFEEVFYNSGRGLAWQIMLILAAVKNDDPDEIADTKIRMISKFVDIFASVRLFNFKKVNWDTCKKPLFRLMREIRNQDCKSIGMACVRALRRMEENLDALSSFCLTRFSRRYMLHFLARFTSYADVLSGNPSHFAEYTDRKRRGNTHDIEHILPDRYDDYQQDFPDYDDFAAARQQIGNLIILTSDKNRSYQALRYEEKRKLYPGDNILARALTDDAYRNNPQFIGKVAERYGFRPIEHFDKESIKARAEIYLKMAGDIWNPADIKELAGGWTDAEEQELLKDAKGRDFTVGYAERSWADALKYGFLSANTEHSGRTLYNVQKGDRVFCYIAGCGFVGIGECLASAVNMPEFTVECGGKSIPVAEAPWADEEAKARLEADKEIFIRVKWEMYVSDPKKAFREKGLTVVPLVAYTLSDKKTHERVLEYFEQRSLA